MGDALEGQVSIIEEDLQRYVELSKNKKKIDQELNQLKKQFHLLLDDTFGKEQKGVIQRGNYKLQRQIRSSISYEEEKTVQKLEELNLLDCIEIIKRPDTEKLDAAIKLGLVPSTAFNHCKLTKLTQAIVVKENDL